MVGMVEGNEAVEYVVGTGDLYGSEVVANLVDGVGVMLLERSVRTCDQETSVQKSAEWSVKRQSPSSIV